MTPRVCRPLSVASASATRALVRSVGRGRTQAGSGSTPGTRRSARQASWKSKSSTNRSGPPPTWVTPCGVPPGSAPTDTTAARASSGTSRGESRPGNAPTGPNSSPATSTRRPVTPCSASQAAAHRAASDLSVKPTSTRATLVVIRGSANPASRAAVAAIATTSVRLASRVVPTPALTATGGSPSRSMVRQFGRVGPMSAPRPLARSWATVSSTARSNARSSSPVACRLHTSAAPPAVTSKTSDPRLTHRKRWPGPAGRAIS